MLDAVLLLASMLLCWAGFGLLALAQARYFGQFYASFRPVDHTNAAQAAIAFIAIGLALALCLKAQGGGFGSLLWVLLVTASAMTVALQLTWAPQHLKPVAWLVKKTFHRVSLS